MYQITHNIGKGLEGKEQSTGQLNEDIHEEFDQYENAGIDYGMSNMNFSISSQLYDGVGRGCS